MTKPRIVITGASGLIGGLLRSGLGDGYDVRGIDRRRGRGAGSRHVNMTHLRSVVSAFSGAEIVVDLAGNPNTNIPWRTVYRNNVPATVNALEAAKRAGVRRVVYASSNHATGMYENDSPYSEIVAGRYEGLTPGRFPMIGATAPTRPDGPYGGGKVLGEAAGRWYSEQFGLSVICLRIGTVNAANRPKSPRHFATLLTHADLVRLVLNCIEASAETEYAIFYGVSNNTWRFWDIGDARDAIGYEPQDDAERWRA